MSAAAAALAFPFTLIAATGFAGFTGFLMFVFRDPRRRPGDGIVAPADGKVREVDQEKGLVSIYLALRNVHVTRAPIEGTIDKVERSLGRHSPAFSKKTPNNERVEISMRTAVGDVSIVHMTGAIAPPPVADLPIDDEKRKHLGVVNLPDDADAGAYRQGRREYPGRGENRAVAQRIACLRAGFERPTEERRDAQHEVRVRRNNSD